MARLFSHSVSSLLYGPESGLGRSPDALRLEIAATTAVGNAVVAVMVAVVVVKVELLDPVPASGAWRMRSYKAVGTQAQRIGIEVSEDSASRSGRIALAFERARAA
ncbi:hypothetical protein, partial [Oceanithermus desulfurans]